MSAGDSFEPVFDQELRKYEPLRQEIQANLQRQQQLMDEISVCIDEREREMNTSVITCVLTISNRN
jgi:hypothetical protein